MPPAKPSAKPGPARPVLRALAVLGAACLAAAAPPFGQDLSPRPVLAPVGPAAEPAGTETRVALGPGGRDIRVAGDLSEGVAARVAALLSAHPGVGRLHLTSDGGLVAEAEALGALVTARGLATYVPDACASACTLVFVRGRERYLATGGRLGFHAPYEADPSGAATPVDPAPERAAYLAAGVPADFAAEALAVPSDDLWIPDPIRLREAGIVTALVDTGRFPDSTLDADPSPAAARAQILRNLPVLAGEVDAVAGLAGWYRDGYLAGRSEAAAIEGLRRRASAHLRRRLRAADDATVLSFAGVVLAALEAADTGAEACEAVADGDLVALDAALRAGRPAAPGLDAILAGTRPDAAARPDGAAPGGPGPCGRLIAATRRARDGAGAAAALRGLLLRDPPAVIASAALP
ncbi:hypothetical protein Q8W71_22005 [Methylobacterium sp. NEAU 140]|uniref:COG3904 family protein n=1 Tax=Methylobacterium sp. NEAU 140 TaxID=3064945 RepID=UPI002736D6E6|nr:hypothetical protein [Methylobacterium sp. NEAU 140]MDP4025309.1 hypothetical protein [Methylobacterium sp. NEAU 140]